jgi:DNA processing protein
MFTKLYNENSYQNFIHNFIIQNKKSYISLTIFSMTDQDLFYLLALQSVEGVGDIMAKTTYTRLGRVCFKTKAQQLAAIDGVGLFKKDQTVLIHKELNL